MAMAFETKRIFGDHQIVVRIAITDHPIAKLYIDGKVVDTCDSSATRSGCLLRGVIENENGQTQIVEVERRVPFSSPKFFVDGTELHRQKKTSRSA
jgi:hypothetical protein